MQAVKQQRGDRHENAGYPQPSNGGAPSGSC
jgi:hypothetical protein